MTAWSQLSPHQQEAAKAAARLVEDAELAFVTMLFSSQGGGAVMSNIEPGDAVRLIEGALMAAKNTASYAEMDMGRPN
jgi:hypothetical protein